MSGHRALFLTVGFTLATCAWVPTARSAEPPRIPISDVKGNPLRYDGRTVELVGILDSGHLGVFLRSPTSDDVIRIRMAPAGKTQGDQLFEQFRRLSSAPELPGDPEQRFACRILGRIRVLKDKGKPRKKYYPQIESPVEADLVRVLSISKVDGR